nr:DUF308 domain-containing protein [Microbacterium lemovicicum]
MSTATPTSSPIVNGIRTALGIGGVLALLAGILIVWQPAAAAVFVTTVIAIYAIAGGIVYATLGIFSKAMSGSSRAFHIVLGLLFVIAGVVAFANLQGTAATLAVFVAVLIGIMWIVEGVVALTTLGGSGTRVWTILFAVISIIAGIYLLVNALLGALVLWLLLGIMLIVLGVVQIVRAFTFGRA